MNPRIHSLKNLSSLLGREEGGQVLALLALGMTAIVGMAAFAIDVGSWYQVTQQAQAAADAGATAAANDLPNNATQAVTDAQAYVNKNISGATTTTVTPYNGNSSQVKVTVSKSAPTFFAKIFGINSVSVTESAAAKANAGTNGRWAVFGYDSTCGDQTITIPGGSNTINGTVRSNGDFKVSGANLTVTGNTTYGGPNHCSWQQSGANPSYNGSTSPTADYTMYDWPEPWTASSIPCTYSNSSGYNFKTQGMTIPSGVYCTTSQIQVSGGDITGNVTFVTPKFNISGANVTLTPYYQDLLIYATGANNSNWSGVGAGTSGTIYMPLATFNMSGGSGVTYNMFIEAKTIGLSGCCWNMNGSGPTATGSSGTQLIE